MIQAAKSRKKTKRTTRKKTGKTANKRVLAETHMLTETRRVGGDMESGQNVDRIRDIIFGPQMRDYERRFKQIEKDIQRTLRNYQDRMDRSERQGSERMQKVAQRTEEAGLAANEVASRLEDLRKATELDQSRLLKADDTLKAEFAKHLNRTFEEFNKHLEEMRDEFRSTLEEMRSEHIQSVEELYSEKVSRGEVGEILIELGLRLKGEEISTK